MKKDEYIEELTDKTANDQTVNEPAEESNAEEYHGNTLEIDTFYADTDTALQNDESVDNDTYTEEQENTLSESDFENEISYFDANEDEIPKKTSDGENEGKGEDDEDSVADEDQPVESIEAINNDAGAKSKSDTQEKPRKIDSIFDFLELFVFTLAAVFIITSFFFRYSIVDGGSMEQTLHDDEKLLLSSFLYTPKCGDIVVVQDKSTALKDPIVKRVIAVGGQTVRFTRTTVYVDGYAITEPYVYTDDYYNPLSPTSEYTYSVYPSDALLPIVTDSKLGEYYEITVPEGEIFVMGDHRNSSMDSREIGTLHEDAVIGKVVFRFFPFSKFGKID